MTLNDATISQLAQAVQADDLEQVRAILQVRRDLVNMDMGNWEATTYPDIGLSTTVIGHRTLALGGKAAAPPPKMANVRCPLSDDCCT